MIDVIANGNELFTMTEGGSGFATIQVPENSQITFEFFADLLANLWYGCEITVNGVNADYMAQLNGEGTSIFYTYRVLPSNYDLYLEVDYRDL